MTFHDMLNTPEGRRLIDAWEEVNCDLLFKSCPVLEGVRLGLEIEALEEFGVTLNH